MIALKIEAYLFSSNFKHPESNDISKLIELFSKYDLLPQYFEEQNLSTNVKNKRMQFTSPFSGYSVKFLSDKILFTVDMNPFNPSDNPLTSQINEFIDFISFTAKAYEGFCLGQLNANRISLVGSFITKIGDPDPIQPVGQKISDVTGWNDSPVSEFMLRTGEKEQQENINEEINVIITINDGMLEQNSNGHVVRNNCFLINADLNTFQEKTSSRFNVDTVISTWKELSIKLLGKLDRVKSFFNN
jgi:hypothetical protein